MRDGVYIPAAVVRLTLLGIVGVGAFLLKKQMPDLRRYIKFETM